MADLVFLVTCAGCTETITLANSRDVYGEADPNPDPTPIADSSRTGWHHLAGGFYCRGCYPAAVEVARTWSDAKARARSEMVGRHARELAHLDLQWAVEHPIPLKASEIRWAGR
jgi:predicted Fe-S protein YdhL (DUF1289 family)